MKKARTITAKPLPHSPPVLILGTKGVASPDRAGEEKRNRKTTVLGIEIDAYTECMWCKEKRSVFDRVAYLQPCEYCRDTPKYRDYKNEKEKEYNKTFGMDAALNASKPAAIWEGRGRQVITNSKGNVIDNVPYKPRPLGRKGTKI